MTALAEPAAIPQQSRRGGWRAGAALGALTLGTFLFVTIETLPVGLLQPIARDLGVSDARVGLLVTWYGLVVVVASLPLTKLTQRVPRRLLLCVLLAVYVLSALGSAVVDSYTGMLVARIVTATSQALFWSVVVPVAAMLVPAKVRGRALAVVMGGGSLAAVAGVPLGTWTGQHLGWRWAFVAAAALGLVALGAIAALLPGADAQVAAPERSSDPDGRRFWALLAMTVLATTGAFTFFTYLSPFLTDGVQLSAGLLSVVLLLRGVAGLAGVAVAGPLVDARPRLAIALPVAVQAGALLLLFWSVGSPLVAVVLVALTGYAFAAFTTPLAARVMQVAPGRIDLAFSGISTAVNVGITLGALIGSALLSGGGVRGTALVGGLLTAAGLVLVVLDRPRTAPGRCRSGGAGSGGR
jgi:MFS transporter, DHA1 family, inner membrane transport protein